MSYVKRRSINTHALMVEQGETAPSGVRKFSVVNGIL